jgi:hypothetical protein
MVITNKIHTSEIIFRYINLLYVLGLSCGYLQGGDRKVKKVFVEVTESIQNIK